MRNAFAILMLCAVPRWSCANETAIQPDSTPPPASLPAPAPDVCEHSEAFVSLCEAAKLGTTYAVRRSCGPGGKWGHPTKAGVPRPQGWTDCLTLKLNQGSQAGEYGCCP